VGDIVSESPGDFISVHPGDFVGIRSLIAVGFGISLVLESDIGANFSGLVYRELRDGTGSSRIGFSAVWRADNENPALQNLLKLLGERYPLGPVAP